MKRITTIAIALMFLAVFLPETYGQSVFSNSEKLSDNWFINLSGGASQFYGDMSHENPYEKLEVDTRFGLSFDIGTMINPAFGLRAQVFYGRLQSNRRAYKQYFIAEHLWETNISVVANLFDMFFGYKQGRFMNVYGTLGVGMAHWKSKRFKKNTDRILEGNGEHGEGPYRLTSEVVFPAGFGAHFYLNEHIDFKVENTWHILYSDILDSKKGGSEYDIFMYTSFGFAYKFNLSKNNSKVEDDAEIQIIVPQTTSTREANRQAEQIKRSLDAIPDPVIVVQNPKNNQAEIIPVVSKPNRSNDIVYKVQIRASKTPLSEDKLDAFNLSHEIEENYTDGWYLYTVGRFDRRGNAEQLRGVLKYSYGIPDAFVVPFLYNQRIKMPTGGLPTNITTGSTANLSTTNTTSKDTEANIYRIQLLSVNSIHEIDPSFIKEKYNISNEIIIIKEGGNSKYQIRDFHTLEKAIAAQSLLIAKGVTDASIISFTKD